MLIHHKKNTAFELAIPMVDAATPAGFKTGLTVSDTAYSKDGAGAWTTLSITDTFNEIGATGMYEISLTAGECNHDWVIIKCTAAGAADSFVTFRMGAVDMDELVRSTTPANTLDVSSTGEAGVDWSNVGSPDTTVSLSATTVATATDVTNDVGVTQVGADKVWSSTTRTITGLTTAAIKSIWDQLTSALTTAGSIGKLLVDNINATIASRASQTDVQAIQNNTRTTIALPTPMERPDAGSTGFKVYLNNYDTAGNMEEPDAAPTVEVVNEAGTDRSGNLQHPTTHVPQTTMVQIEAGRYWIEYDLDTADALESLTVTFSVTEGGVTRKVDRGVMIVDTTKEDFTSTDRSDLGAIKAKTDLLQFSGANDVKATLDGEPVDLSAQAKLDVNAEVDAALNTAIPGSPAADSINERIQAIDDKLPAGSISGFDAAGDNVIVGDLVAGAMAKFFSIDSGTSYASSVAGSVVKEIADNAGGGGGETKLRSGTAQAGGASSITLDAGASGTNDHYKHSICALTGGTGSGQGQIIDSYDGSSKVCTMAASWAITPDNTTTFVILPLGTIPGASAPSAAAVADAVFDEVAADHDSAGSFGSWFNDIKSANRNKKSVDRTTGDITVYKDDNVTPRFTRRPTEIDANTQALVPQ